MLFTVFHDHSYNIVTNTNISIMNPFWSTIISTSWCTDGRFCYFVHPMLLKRRLYPSPPHPPLPPHPPPIVLALSTSVTLRSERERDKGRQNRRAEQKKKNLYFKKVLLIFPSSVCLLLSQDGRSPSPCSYQTWKAWLRIIPTDPVMITVAAHWLQGTGVPSKCFPHLHSFYFLATVSLGRHKSSILSETFCYIIYTCISFTEYCMFFFWSIYKTTTST